MISILNESIPYIDKFRNRLGNLARLVDIENLDGWQEYHFTGPSREYTNYFRNGIIVYVIDGSKLFNSSDHYAMSVYGKWISAPEIAISKSVTGYNREDSWDWYDFSKLPMKIKCKIVKEFWCVIPSEENKQNLADLRQQRADARKGSVDRYGKVKGYSNLHRGIVGGNSKANPGYGLKFDKSGYIISPNKYKDMLADMNLNNASNILAQAKKVYLELIDKIDQIDFTDYDIDSDYSNIVRDMVSAFRKLDIANKEYNSNISSEWRAADVKASIKVIRDCIIRARKFI